MKNRNEMVKFVLKKPKYCAECPLTKTKLNEIPRCIPQNKEVSAYKLDPGCPLLVEDCESKKRKLTLGVDEIHKRVEAAVNAVAALQFDSMNDRNLAAGMARSTACYFKDRQARVNAEFVIQLLDGEKCYRERLIQAGLVINLLRWLVHASETKILAMYKKLPYFEGFSYGDMSTRQEMIEEIVDWHYDILRQDNTAMFRDTDSEEQLYSGISGETI